MNKFRFYYLSIVFIGILMFPSQGFTQSLWAENLTFFLEPINAQLLDTTVVDTFAVDLDGLVEQSMLINLYFGLDTSNTNIDSLLIEVIEDSIVVLNKQYDSSQLNLLMIQGAEIPNGTIYYQAKVGALPFSSSITYSLQIRSKSGILSEKIFMD